MQRNSYLKVYTRTWCKSVRTQVKKAVLKFYVRDCTFFFSSTDIALASLRNIALPQRSSRKLVN